MDIGKRLLELREATGLSQSDVEDRTGLPQDEILNIENGQGTPTLPMLEKWANALGVVPNMAIITGEQLRV